MSTAPLREALTQVLPERPFRVTLWDGSELPSTSGDGPVFSVRSPAALGHMLRAPGQLGLGRAYYGRHLERLEAVRERYDPDRRFRFPRSI